MKDTKGMRIATDEPREEIKLTVNRKGEEMKTLKRFWESEEGLETVEYAIILGLIVAATVFLIVTLGQWVRGRFSTVVEVLAETDNQ